MPRANRIREEACENGAARDQPGAEHAAARDRQAEVDHQHLNQQVTTRMPALMVMKVRPIALMLVLALAAAFATAYAADKPPPQDKRWLQNAHQLGLGAIDAGKIAGRRSKLPALDKAAKKIVEDDQALNDELKTLAKDMGVRLADKPSAQMQSQLQYVDSKSGGEFDKAWTRMMIETELKAANKTQQEIAKGESEKIKRIAKKALPVINLQINMLQYAKSKFRKPESTPLK
ncbi:MAG TPA: DUF4142 domain-containing protein [Gammaproteobacteria bacterium]|nr:DUF4142 domain-containing protein [Gammaproteobacteria bacterium]